ncbi:3-keto-disaccharide hydrolase [Rubinisphaera margarita]|uniref:3-keto-disaccharide hydrolase n=1 Tax=Rubinisphaera margarita TaxID=2909586 RepID=UPI001EE82C6E|nr:DUF1080 domain-containing protein [Rubinisphaera margarita]MCG6157118.1 DUF1080 domain-containing protein [Rubinisphaera margarita]
MMRLTCLVLGVLIFGASSGVVSADDFKPLFDGETLDGWVQKGGEAEYRVEDEQIVGTSKKGTPNSFLATEKNYDNFELILEFKPDETLNSGVQIRSNMYDEPKTYTWNVDGKEKSTTVKAGRVHGYQVEIDPSARAWTGGIYDEGRRGWLNNLADNEAARKAFKPGEWNEFRVVANGDSIKTFLNGVPAADLKDDLTSEGFIALQVHSFKEDGHEIRWRNIRIRELP